MAKKAPKKNQKEEPLKVDMNPDDLLLLMGRTSPIKKKGKAKAPKKEKKG